MTRTPRITLGILLSAPIFLAASTLAGCHAAPRHAADSSLTADAAPSQYWKVNDLPPLPESGRRSLALAEFSVEYVTEKKLGLFGSRPVAGVDEFSISGGIADIVGIGKDRLELDSAEMARIPSILAADFEKHLTEAGFDVLPPAQIAAGASYASIEGLTPGAAYPVEFLNVVGSDTGRPKAIKVYPAQPLKVLPGDPSAMQDHFSRILADTRADVALAVRLRVGVDRGFASVERDSSFVFAWVPPTDGTPSDTTLRTGKAVAVRSLLSDDKVTLSENFQPFRGDVNSVDAAKFESALRAVLGPYTELAFRQVRSNSEPTTAKGGPPGVGSQALR